MLNRVSYVVLAGALSVAGCHRNGGRRPNRPPAPATPVAAGGTVDVEVSERGFRPSRISAPHGSQFTIVFHRLDDHNCGERVVFPSMRVTRDIPVNQATSVQVRSPPQGEINFTCGMNMYQGFIVAL